MRRRRRTTAQAHPELRHDGILVAYISGFENPPFYHYKDTSCHINYEGKMYEGFLVGYCANKPTDKFLVYIENIDFGSDGTEHKLTIGEPYRGQDTNHVWCSLAKDAMDLLKRQNTIYMQSDYHSIRRDEYLTIDRCTYNAMVEKYCNSEQGRKDNQTAIKDALYELFCGKTVKFARQHAIRQLDMED